jgi:hypothetical protein
MRFLSIYTSRETGTPPSPQHMEDMTRLIEKFMKTGELIATEGCLPTALGARVRKDGSTLKVTDGPFTEAKEVVGGYAIVQAKSKEEALEWAKRFVRLHGDDWKVTSEVRQIEEPPEDWT